MPRWNKNKEKKGNKKAITTTLYSRNNKQRNTSDRTTIISIGMMFVLLALLYPAVGTFRLSMVQKQLLQPIQDQPLLHYNDNNKNDNKVDEEKKESEKEIASKTDSTQKQHQERLSTKLVRAKKVSLNESNTTTAVHVVAMMTRSNNRNNNYGFKKQQHGFINIDDDSSSVAATKLHHELETCFSLPLSKDYAEISKWLQGGGCQNFTCHLAGIGSFQIMKCMSHDICFIESRDEEDYGTSYFMKLRHGAYEVHDEMKILHYLSTINKGTVKNLTAKPHPQYPYIGWKRTLSTTTNTTNDKKNKHKKKEQYEKVAVIFEERLNFTSFSKFINKLQTMDQIMSSSNQKQIVQCWRDVLTVTEALWDYQGGHYVHNDIHNQQVLMVPITKGGNNSTNDANSDADDMDSVRYRCHVIDFGKVRSLDQATKSYRKSLQYANTNPFWYTQLSKTHNRVDYIREHGIEEYYKRGWEFSITQWGQILFLKPLLRIMLGDGRPLSFDNTKKYDEYDITVAGWCHASTMIRELVHKLEQYQKQRPDIDDAIIHLVIEQSTLIDKGMSILNCTYYEVLFGLTLT